MTSRRPHRGTALLVAQRRPGDLMLEHEAAVFAARAGLQRHQLHVHPIMQGRLARSELARHDAVFFGGSGDFSVLEQHAWLDDAMAVIDQVLELGIPGWASCFGFQGLAQALGGTVIHDDDLTEMGSTWLTLTEQGRSDPVTGVLPAAGFWAQEGHHDHVVELPAGVTLLARGERVPLQAFKVDGAPFYASQFHPELRVEDTVTRFRHYQDNYLGDRDASLLDALMNGQDTAEMADVLPRLLSLRK
ncbi:MAG: type 1 glutamine amidotransferase [Myxococcales bacterium]|nr:type 1 glutamine amidotransferase [Myxococcales bacterium]